MKAKVFLLTLLVASVTAGTTLNYGEAEAKFTKSLIKAMPCGIPALDLPVMDPLISPDDGYNMTKNGTHFIIPKTNIKIYGLSKLQVLDTSYNETTLRTDFDYVFPTIQFFGVINFDSNLAFGGISLAFVETLYINTKISDIRLVGDYTFEEKKGLRIKNFNIRIFIADVEVDNWADHVNIAANDYVNKLVSSLVLFLIKQIQPFVNANFNYYFLTLINVMLSRYSLDELTDAYVRYAEELDKVNCNL